MAVDKKYFDGFVPFSIANVKVRWCKLVTPDTAFGKSEWCVDIELGDELAKTMKDAGWNVKTYKGESQQFITAKRKTMSGKGVANKPPLVVGKDGSTPFTEDIGNGTLVNINISGRAWDVNPNGIACYFGGMQVVDHVPYGGGGGFSAIEEDSPF